MLIPALALFAPVLMCHNPHYMNQKFKSVIHPMKQLIQSRHLRIESNTATIKLLPGIFYGNAVVLDHETINFQGSRNIRNEPSSILLFGQLLSKNQQPHDPVKQNHHVKLFSIRNSTVGFSIVQIDLTSAPNCETANAGGFRHKFRFALIESGEVSVYKSSIRTRIGENVFALCSGSGNEPLEGSHLRMIECSFMSEKGLMGAIGELIQNERWENGEMTLFLSGSRLASTEVSGRSGILLSGEEGRDGRERVQGISATLDSSRLVNISATVRQDKALRRELVGVKGRMTSCIVIESSSVLSGSCLQDVTDGGSLLCQNSSFLACDAPLFARTVNSGEVITPGGSTDFDPSIRYATDPSFSSENSITFSQCDFTAADRNIGEAALSFTDFAGKIKLENCAFTRDPSHDGWNKGCFTVTSDTFIDFTCTGCAFSRCRSDEFGSAIDIFIDSDYPIDSRSQILLTTTNFSDCFSASTGGALRLFGPIGEQILTNLRFVGCSSERGRGGSFAVTHFRSSVTISSLLCENSHSGYMEGSAHISMNPSSDDTIVFILSNSIFKSCSAVKLNVGIEPFTGALSIDSSGEGKACTATIEGCLFEECSAPAIGALSLSIPFHTTVSGCSFVKCVAPSYGSAMSLTSDGVGSLILQDIQIINCSLVSCIELSYYTTKPVIFTRVLFANEDQSINLEDHEDGLPFCEIQVYNGIPHDQPYSLTIENCWTTAARPTIFEYADHSAGAQNVGPLLTTQVKGETNGAGKLRVEIEAWFPNVEQQCEVKMREKGNEEEITFTILMNGSKGMSDWFVPGTIPADKLLGKTFTLTSIIALRGSDQPSSNAVFTFAKVPLLFDLTANSSFLTFTLPSTLPAIVSNADAALVSDDSNLATITLEGQNSLSGSMECTVMEDGKEVSFTVQMRTLAGVFIGTSHEIVVVGKDRVLTHNTTYKVLSLRKSPNNTADDVPIEIVEGLSFTIPLSSFPDKKTLSPEMKTLLSWLIPLVCVLVLCLIVSIVVIVIVHKRKKATEARMKEMAEQDPPDSIEVKVEEVKETAGVQQISQLVEQNAFIHTESGKTLLTDQDKTDREQTLGEPMDVMMCGEKCEVTVIGATTTLYEKLHKDGTGFDKRAVQKALVKGVGALVELNTETAALRQMSPHSVFVDKQNRVFIQLRFDEHARIEAMIREMNEAQKQETDPTKPPANTEQKADYLRWQPPEVVEKQEQIDNGKASVFSLGLLLWEIETRLVPFAEQDVVNACRQMGLGIVPPMQKVRDEDLKEMLVRCLSVDPDNRPPLTELTSFIDTHSFRDSPPNSHQPYHSPA